MLLCKYWKYVVQNFLNPRGCRLKTLKFVLSYIMTHSRRENNNDLLVGGGPVAPIRKWKTRFR